MPSHPKNGGQWRRRRSIGAPMPLAYPSGKTRRREDIMYRATKDIILPTTITGSLPRPSWYTENLGTPAFPRGDGRPPLPRAVRGCAHRLSARPGAGRSRHPDRRRLPVRRRRRRPELDWLSAEPHDRLRPQPAADAGGARRRLLSARPYPARLSGIAGHAADHRADRPRQPAVHRDVEDGAAASPSGRSSSAACRRRSSPSRCRTPTTTACPTACWRSPRRSTRSTTSSPTPAAR